MTTCKAAASAAVGGSPQRLPVPCERSTTPLSCGRRGGLNWIGTPSPASHNSRSVGRSPREPQGVPLSPRKAPGRPQTPKAWRNPACVRKGGTAFQSPWGENVRLQERPAALIDQAQPTDQGAVADAHPLGGVELPDLVRLGGPPLAPPGSPPFGGGAEAGAGQVALQGALAGQGAVGVALGEQHAEQPGPPAGVPAAHLQRGGEQLGIG